MAKDFPWTHKHSPKHTKDVVGHETAIREIKHYLEHYRKEQPPILLLGKQGIGKTCLVHALAHELDLELLEMNAADTRNKDAIETIIGGATLQQSLFFRKKAILVDEVDAVSGTKDRGGVQALLAAVERSAFPIIFTANDPDSDKIKSLKKACDVIELELSDDEVLSCITRLAKIEGVSIEDELLSAMSRRAGGDLRAAINDLQSLGTGKKIMKVDVESLSDRQNKEEIRNALLRIFKTTSADVALPSFDNVDEDVDALLLWIDENIPREYKTPEDLSRAFDALAEADKYFGRIRRWQYYRFYVYIYNLLSAGIALAKDKKYAGVTEYKPTGRILKLWIYNQKNFKKKKIAEQLAPHLHTSKKRVMQDVLPYVKIIYKYDRKQGERIVEQYGIDDETAEWLS